MPDYKLIIGDRSFVINAFSEDGARRLSASTVCAEMNGGDEVTLMTDPEESLLLKTTVAAMQADNEPCR